MISLILRTAARLLVPLLLLFALFLLVRGHNAPGGGFSGGLVAAAALMLYAIADGTQAARRVLRVDPQLLIGAGLGLAALSGVAGWIAGLPYLTGVWYVSPSGAAAGTPLLFDAGVFLVVVGAALTILLTLAEEQ